MTQQFQAIMFNLSKGRDTKIQKTDSQKGTTIKLCVWNPCCRSSEAPGARSKGTGQLFQLLLHHHYLLLEIKWRGGESVFYIVLNYLNPLSKQSRAEKFKSLICWKRLKGGKRRKKAEKGGKGEFGFQLDFWQKSTSLVEMS